MKTIVLRSVQNFGNLVLMSDPKEHLDTSIEDILACGWFLCRKRTSLFKEAAFGNLIEYTLRNDDLKKECMLLKCTITACKKCRKKFIV